MMIIGDLETTGVNVFDAEIVTGYFLSVNPDTFEILGQFELKCNPFKWSYEAQEIHGITREEAATFRKFSEVYENLINWLITQRASEFWCHAKVKMYGKLTFFDHAVLRLRMMEMGDFPYFEIEKLKPYSTHSLASVLASDYGFEKFSLDYLCSRLGITLKHHDAKSDTLACYEIIKKLLPMTNREALLNYEREIKDEDSTRTSKRNSRKPRGVQGFD
jgi:DNA polymerase III epsilon subunit-like protein